MDHMDKYNIVEVLTCNMKCDFFFSLKRQCNRPSKMISWTHYLSKYFVEHDSGEP